MTTPDLSRKVQRLDNDVHEIGAKVEEHDARFDSIDTKLDRVIEIVSRDPGPV
jgi:peptidoglycan hydrolase CwlO-like protein